MARKTAYERYTEEGKKKLGKRANAYQKENYKKITIILKPEIFDEFEALREAEGLTRSKLIEKFLENYKKELALSD